MRIVGAKDVAVGDNVDIGFAVDSLGEIVGVSVAAVLLSPLGAFVGASVATVLLSSLGALVGALVGDLVGRLVGDDTGASVALWSSKQYSNSGSSSSSVGQS